MVCVCVCVCTPLNIQVSVCLSDVLLCSYLIPIVLNVPPTSCDDHSSVMWLHGSLLSALLLILFGRICPNRYGQHATNTIYTNVTWKEHTQTETRRSVCGPVCVCVSELDSPVKTQGVQEGRQSLHDEQDADCEHGEGREDNGQREEAAPAAGRQSQVHDHGPQHLRQLCRTATYRGDPPCTTRHHQPPATRVGPSAALNCTNKYLRNELHLCKMCRYFIQSKVYNFNK